MLRYQTLKYFTVVAQYESMTRAAESLFLTQSGLSIHMRNLENELGVTLFTRTNRNVKLTPAGQVLYDWAAPFFAREKSVIQAVQQKALLDQSSITIGTIGANITYFLSDFIQSFQEHYGGIPVTIRRMNMDPLSEAMAKNTVDLAFRFLPDRLEDQFESFILERGQLVLAVHKSSPLAKKSVVSYRDLKGVPIACLASSSASHPREILMQDCAKFGFKPNIIEEFDYVEPLLSMVNMGSCVTLTSDLAPVNGLENIRYIPMAEARELSLAMVWRKDLANPAAQRFIRHVIDLSSKAGKSAL